MAAYYYINCVIYDEKNKLVLNIFSFSSLQPCAEVYKTKNEFEAKTASASQLSIVTLLLIPARAIASQIGRKHNWVGADWTKAGLAAPAIGRPLPSKRGPCTKLVTEIPRLSPNAEANTREIQKSEHNINSIAVASWLRNIAENILATKTQAFKSQIFFTDF